MFCDRACIKKLVEAGISRLNDLRRLCGDLPLRMLVTTSSNHNAEIVAEVCEKLCAEKKWGLTVRLYNGGVPKEIIEDRRKQFECEKAVPNLKHEKELIDILVQCKMLSEG
jgi:hypothetical protein